MLPIEHIPYVISGEISAPGDLDLRPEPIQLPIRPEIRWLGYNRPLRRGQSTIGNANPKSSQRFNHNGAAIFTGIQSNALRLPPSPPPPYQIFPLSFAISGVNFVYLMKQWVLCWPDLAASDSQSGSDNSPVNCSDGGVTAPQLQGMKRHASEDGPVGALEPLDRERALLQT